MIDFKKSQTHTVDTVFILALLALFAATAFFVVSIGARQYQSIADSMTKNYESRTISSYLEEKVNQNDISGSISIAEVGTSQALVFSETVNDVNYFTYLYAYQGFLWEITVSEGTAVKPGDGQKIIETGGFSVSTTANSLYCITVTDTTGDTYPLYISLNAK